MARSVIPGMDFGGSGPPVIFLHGNGYPPGCYLPLLTRLATDFRVSAVLQRPLWAGSDPQDIRGWAPLSGDLIQFLEENQALPALAVGHSLGAIVALRAAVRQQEKFGALVLIEPVLFPPRRILEAWLWHLTGRMDRHPLIIASTKRRRTFDDLDRLFASYRQRSIFRYMNDEALWTYIRSISCPAGDGTYRLCYSPEWETRIYATGIWRDLDLWWGLRSLKVPTVVLRGAETDTFWESTAQRVRRTNPRIDTLTFPTATHLLPMERPEETACAIQAFFSTQVANPQ